MCVRTHRSDNDGYQRVIPYMPFMINRQPEIQTQVCALKREDDELDSKREARLRAITCGHFGLFDFCLDSLMFSPQLMWKCFLHQ